MKVLTGDKDSQLGDGGGGEVVVGCPALQEASLVGPGDVGH